MNDQKAAYEWGERLPTLTAKRVTLRELDEADLSDLFAVFSDPEVMRYWSSPPLSTEEEALVLLQEIREGFRTRNLFQWGIANGRDGEVVGTCTLYHLDLAHRRAEVGFALAQRCWGQGFATEALTALIGFAFQNLKLHRLEADADPRNDRSLRVLERQGFRREGYLRERYHLGGEAQDAMILGLLRHEWTPPRTSER